MKLEDEKKLVAKWMGVILKPNKNGYLLREVPHFKLGLPDTQLVIWNPQDNDKATCKEWDEIWDKMDGEIFNIYIETLIFKLKESWSGSTYRHIHTAKPEICWEALIKTLEAK